MLISKGEESNLFKDLLDTRNQNNDKLVSALKMLYAERGAMKTRNHQHGGLHELLIYLALIRPAQMIPPTNPKVMSLIVRFPVTVKAALTPMSQTVRFAPMPENPTLKNLHHQHRNEEEKPHIDSILQTLKEPSIKTDL